MDHVYPESKGGATSVDNLATSCANCNVHKSFKIGQWPKPLGYWEEADKINSEHTARLQQEHDRFEKEKAQLEGKYLTDFKREAEKRFGIWDNLLTLSSVGMAIAGLFIVGDFFGLALPSMSSEQINAFVVVSVLLEIFVLGMWLARRLILGKVDYEN